MTALSADKKVQYRDAVTQEIPVAADEVIYLGAHVCFNTSGYAVPAAAVAGYKYAGWAQEKVDNTGGADGDKTVIVRRVGQVKTVASGLTQAKVGDAMYVVDDQTVQPLPAGTAVADEELVADAGGTAVADEELVADAGGALTMFEGTLANTGVMPGTVAIAATVGAAAKAMADDGNGNLFGEGVGTGIIDYATGYYRLNFDTAPDDDTAITASYNHQTVGPKMFEGTLANTGVVPGGVSIAATVGAAAVAMADDGKGNLFGEGVGTGIIDYATGYYRLNFDTAPDDESAITASYNHTQVLVEAGKLAKYESATSGWLMVG